MFNKKALFGLTVFAFSCFLGVTAADAQISTPPCYTLESLQGQYATVGMYGANQAVVFAMSYFDGNGNYSSTFVVNEPTSGSTTGARTIVTGKNVGTYTVNCDGTGVVTRTVTASNDVTATQTDDFVITGAFAKLDTIFNPILLATSVANAPRVSSALVPGGVLLTRSLTRLPDRPSQP